VCILAKDPVIAHHPHTMTIRLSGFCRTSRTLPHQPFETQKVLDSMASLSCKSSDYALQVVGVRRTFG
jgi:hypothetical protein